MLGVISVPTTAEGRPIIPQAERIVEEDNGFYTAYFEPVNERWTSLLQMPDGRWLLFPHNMALPPAATTWREFVQAVGIRQWRWWKVTGVRQVVSQGSTQLVPITDFTVRLPTPVPGFKPSVENPWVFGPNTVTHARPTLPSRIAGMIPEELEEELP